MDKKVKVKVPAIRFKGFSEPWCEKIISDICSNTFGGGTPKTSENNYWAGTIPWIQSSDVLENEIYKVKPKRFITQEAISNSAAKLVPENSIAIVTRVGVGKLSLIDFQYTTSQDFLSLGRLNVDRFFAARLISLKLVEKLHETQGTSIKGITKEELLSYEVAVPQQEVEQQKIGRLFKQLDTILEQHQAKLDKLKTLKQTMLQKMFPQGDAVIPEIRFEGFTAAWQKKQLGLITDPVSSNTLSRAKLNYHSGGAKNIHYGDILVKFGSILNPGRSDVPYVSSDEVVSTLRHSKLMTGDIVFSDAAEDETVGKCVELVNVGETLVLSGLHTIALRPIVPFATAYLGYYLNSNSYRRQLLPLMQGTKVLSLSRTALASTHILFPDCYEEQLKVGSYFRRLDELISMRCIQLEKMKQIKQAYLFKMFVS